MTITRRADSFRPLRQLRVPKGLASLPEVEAEIDRYLEVMRGDVPPPFDNGVLTLQETADAYYARVREIEGLIYRGERHGEIPKHLVASPSPWNQFRTGELQSYIALFRHASELGSRRVTAAVEFRDEE